MYRVEVEVSGDLQEIAVFIDEKGFITSLIQMTGPIMTLVEIARIRIC